MVGLKDPQGRGMDCACHPGHVLQCRAPMPRVMCGSMVSTMKSLAWELVCIRVLSWAHCSPFWCWRRFRMSSTLVYFGSFFMLMTWWSSRTPRRSVFSSLRHGRLTWKVKEICCASVGAVTVPLLPDQCGRGKVQKTLACPQPPDTSRLGYVARCTRPVFPWPCSMVVKYGDQLAPNCSGYAAMTMPWSAGFVASKTETKNLQLYLVSRISPGWGQSHIFRTCPGKPVVWFYRERSDFFRTSIVERTSGGDFVN